MLTTTSFSTTPATIWVADDDASIRAYLFDVLNSRGYKVCCVASGEELLKRVRGPLQPALLLLDMRMPPMSGFDVLSEMEKVGSAIPSIILSVLDDIPTVVQAMRLGAADYLVKPVDQADLQAAIDRVLTQAQGALRTASSGRSSVFTSSNHQMTRVRAICDKVAPTNVPVLILGESGVGKEVVAHYLHSRYSPDDPFVKVNCAALPADLLESELFGHERGAFTGALHEKPGKFELAGSGTIMLDEIAEMSPLLQAKLLHVLQDGEYSRLGGSQTLTSQARIIAATNKHLPHLVASGAFREDLYFRLNVVTIKIPPLRERRDDIAMLANDFLERYRDKYNSRIDELPAELLSAFREYSWPGNVRQLENAVRRFLILPEIDQAIVALEEKLLSSGNEQQPIGTSAVSLKKASASAAQKAEKDLIYETLDELNWNRKKAAQRLGICYKSLLNKLHRWESEQDSTVETSSYRAGAGR